jgi:hypothetical protein
VAREGQLVARLRHLAADRPHRGLLAWALGIPLIAVGAIADSGIAVLVGQIVVGAVAYSFTALAGTLLFFDLRARERDVPRLPGGYYPQIPPADWDAPERPY